MIDEITKYKVNKYLYAKKEVKTNDVFLNMHYPDTPIFPGVMTLEFIAQASSMLDFLSNGKLKKKELYFLYKVSELKFRYPVVSKDVMFIKVFLKKTYRRVSEFSGYVFVKKKVICNFYISCIRKRII